MEDIVNFNLVIIIVLYRIKLDQSITFNALNNLPDDVRAKLNLVIYENSAEDTKLSTTIEMYTQRFGNITGYASSENGGVVAGYNYALNQSIEQGCSWLLLLDQDTQLTNEYFNEVFNFLTHNQAAIAFIPKIAHGMKVFAPNLGLFKKPFTGYGQLALKDAPYFSTISSGLLINVRVMQKLGGFNKEFWLDGLDHWLFCMLCKQQAIVYVGTVILEHQLSVKGQGYVQLPRYDNILNSEKLLYQDYWDKKQKIFYIFSLFYRMGKFILRKQFKYFRVTYKQFLSIL